MAKTKAALLCNKAKGAAYASGGGFMGVKRLGSKYGWKYEDGKTSQQKGGFDTAEEAAYAYDEFLIAYKGPDADTNQAFGYLKQKQVLEIRQKISKRDKHKPKTSLKSKGGKLGVKGVYELKSKNKPYIAQVSHNNKMLTVGTFTNLLEAARAYDSAAVRYKGAEAVTNVKLGLIPPIGQDHLFVMPEGAKAAAVKLTQPRKAKPTPAVNDADADDDTQPDFNTGKQFTPSASYDAEREAQIIAARAMQDIDNESVGCGETSHEPLEVNADQPEKVSSPFFEPEEPRGEPAEPVAAITSHEVIVMSHADKLRARAEEMMREAAALDAGNIKQEAAAKLGRLNSKLKGLEAVTLKMIDYIAEIEKESESLRELLK